MSDPNQSITSNKHRIRLLEQVNIALMQQNQVKSDINQLKEELALKKHQEQGRLSEYDKQQKCFLQTLENDGSELCGEHARCLHQIEHLDWHLEHKHMHSGSQKRCKMFSMNHNAPCANKTIDTHNMVNTSESLIKTIADLRRKIHAAKQKLEKKADQKKIAECDLAKLRKDISLQKKYFSSKRAMEN